MNLSEEIDRCTSSCGYFHSDWAARARVMEDYIMELECKIEVLKHQNALQGLPEHLTVQEAIKRAEAK